MHQKPNVHAFKNRKNETRYAVGLYNEQAGQYEAPLDAEQRRLTGCSAEFGAPWRIWNSNSEAAARRRA